MLMHELAMHGGFSVISTALYFLFYMHPGFCNPTFACYTLHLTFPTMSHKVLEKNIEIYSLEEYLILSSRLYLKSPLVPFFENSRDLSGSLTDQNRPDPFLKIHTLKSYIEIK